MFSNRLSALLCLVITCGALVPQTISAQPRHLNNYRPLAILKSDGYYVPIGKTDQIIWGRNLDIAKAKAEKKGYLPISSYCTTAEPEQPTFRELAPGETFVIDIEGGEGEHQQRSNRGNLASGIYRITAECSEVPAVQVSYTNRFGELSTRLETVKSGKFVEIVASSGHVKGLFNPYIRLTTEYDFILNNRTAGVQVAATTVDCEKGKVKLVRLQ